MSRAQEMADAIDAQETADGYGFDVYEFGDRDYERTFSADYRAHVRVRVKPPVHMTNPDDPRHPSAPLRLRAEEGWIDVRVTADGQIELNGCHPLTVESDSSNGLRVRLRDDWHPDPEPLS